MDTVISTSKYEYVHTFFMFAVNNVCLIDLQVPTLCKHAAL